jgi:hypothetical protein
VVLGEVRLLLVAPFGDFFFKSVPPPLAGTSNAQFVSSNSNSGEDVELVRDAGTPIPIQLTC